ncbi:hypothetical protein C4N9_20715 [Pararhodobacter marinus]|uniref:Uncharacterized protein n=1 Tax=Pararhodobacter marinus TaxID=2184063 RepID=A0A2U2C470_9RHOB|nr:hypothetical protein [Pararhodobacter marinus]PWE26686.1 hypothetical protein C4N9_20715 [Pararhodobacter marinus]
MTFREKLADFISGGALSNAVAHARMFADMVGEAYGQGLDACAKANAERDGAEHAFDIATSQRDHYKAALTRIAAMGTPGMASIGKRMAKEAREALGVEHV